MIAKMVKGRGFRGAAEYDLDKENSQILASNMAGSDARELAAEFGQVRKLRPNLGKAVLHVSISAAPGERLTDDQWIAIGEKYLRGMGFKDNQYLITRHTDTTHEHIHILANRITLAGGVVSDGQDYKRQETIMREIERDYGLQRVAPSQEAERKAPTKGEIENAVRTGQPSTRQQLQQLCDAAAKDCRSFSAYQERLEAAGVELVPVAQFEGAKISGLSYRLDGVTMKGSDLGRGYTAAGLAKRGVNYEQDRDFAGVRRSIERDAARAASGPDRDRATGQAPERAGPGRDPGATGPGDGRADGRDPPDPGRDRAQEPGAGEEVQPSAQHGGPDLAGDRSAGADRRPQPEPGREEDGVDALRPGPGDGPADSGARERVLALSGTADSEEPTRPESGSAVPEARRDRSAEAVERQISALGGDRFEVGIREAATGKMMHRQWHREEIAQAIPWLKRMNARGNDIYIRPVGDHGMVLVDDLKPDAITRMAADGLLPTALIETSPANYQTWIKLSEKPLPAELRKVLAQEFAHQYGGDPASADAQHYGRLAGFTNQKPQYARNGRQPYVLAHACPGQVAARAPEALQRGESSLVRVERDRRLKALQTTQPKTYSGRHDPVHEYQRQAQRLLQRYGPDADFSRLDWMIAKDMAQSGRFTVQDIERGIRECSPHIESRKVGHVEDYARRTAVKAVLEFPLDRQAQRDRDRWSGLGR